MGPPAGVGQHAVAHGVVGMPRLLDHADGPADQHVADLDRVGVGLRGTHPPAHVGVEREVDDAQQQLAVGRRRHLVVGEREAVVAGLALGAPGEPDLGGAHANRVLRSSRLSTLCEGPSGSASTNLDPTRVLVPAEPLARPGDQLVGVHAAAGPAPPRRRSPRPARRPARRSPRPARRPGAGPAPPRPRAGRR